MFHRKEVLVMKANYDQETRKKNQERFCFWNDLVTWVTWLLSDLEEKLTCHLVTWVTWILSNLEENKTCYLVTWLLDYLATY